MHFFFRTVSKFGHTGTRVLQTTKYAHTKKCRNLTSLTNKHILKFRLANNDLLWGTTRRYAVTIAQTGTQVKDILAQPNRLVVLMYSAQWCGPCRVMKPQIETMSEEMQDGVEFVTIDIDELPNEAEEAGVSKIPTFVIMKDGKKADKLVGANADMLKNAIEIAKAN